jgi:hypothetical protein
MQEEEVRRTARVYSGTPSAVSLTVAHQGNYIYQFQFVSNWAVSRSNAAVSFLETGHVSNWAVSRSHAAVSFLETGHVSNWAVSRSHAAVAQL